VPTIVFEYVGATAMVAVGSATGRAYRFDHPGARLEVHARDAPGLAAIAALAAARPPA
jgi:hypothetical protein